ncbi:MAG TPA: protein kinase [Ktedonobacteraceae bacterium]|nr:protein kinase [Ktedonobacteraceae bacterium]
MQTLEGTQLGNYDVIRRIRVGGMGAVYEGRQRTAFGRRVAIKVILGSYATDREMRRRFAREARTIARLQHPHILQLIEFGEQAGMLYLVMPFIEGGTLTSYLRRELPTLQEIAAIYLQLLDAVEYAHDEGLIHRDIKSSNVLLDARRGGAPYVYLADFGLVRTSKNLELEETGKPIPLDQVPGTPHYMAPEQTRGIVTPATDIYALGVLLYQMLTGELPFDDPDDVKVVKMHLYSPVPSPCERDASVPLELGEVVRKAMAKRPEQRFANVDEMRAAFSAAVEGPLARVTEDDPEIDIELTPPPQPSPPRRMSIPLSRPEQRVQPLPATVRRRPRAMPPMRLRLDGSKRRKNRRFALAVMGATLVPVVLLLVLVLPRVLGISLFPVGFPLVGASPIATVTVTIKSQTVQDTYLLMASPQVAQPDLATRAIPDRLLTANASGNRATSTSGVLTIPGKQASGTLFFDNSSHQNFSLQSGTPFMASDNLQVVLTQSVNIPPRSDGADGTASATAVVATPGVAGNIAAGALTTTCCNNQVVVSNPQAFTGGVDPRTAHIVAQADLDGASNALIPGLEKQALQKIQSQIAANEVKAGSPSFTVQTSSNQPVGARANTVNVQVNVTASVTVYNTQSARQVAQQLLGEKAVQSLGTNFSLKDPLVVANPVITSQEKDGVIYLSVSVHGLWFYQITQQQTNQWRQSIKGATPQLARAFITTQPGVTDAQIKLPFGTDHLPISVDQIQVVLVNA